MIGGGEGMKLPSVYMGMGVEEFVSYVFQQSSMDWWNWHLSSGGAYISWNGGRLQGMISWL